MNGRIYTIGHSTRSTIEFIQLLKAYNIEIVVDVRTVPRSRHNPQFNKDELKKYLANYEIRYIHMAGLGGLRHTSKDSINTAWKNASFRGYADYMQTPEFKKNLNQLINTMSEGTTVIMCAEAVPWRCHRSLIGDVLLARDIEVIDIFSEKSAKPHLMTSFAQIEDDTVKYPFNEK